MKYAWINLTTSSVTSKLIGIRLLKRMIKVKKFNPKLLAPPSAKKQSKSKNIQDHISKHLYTMYSEYCINCCFLKCSVSNKKLQNKLQYHLLINTTFRRVKDPYYKVEFKPRDLRRHLQFLKSKLTSHSLFCYILRS